MKRKTILILLSIFLLIILLLISLGGYYYMKINSSAFESTEENRKITIYIDDKKNYSDVLSQLEASKIKNISFFKTLAEYMKYPENVKSGKYELNSDISFLELIRRLRSGNQTPVKVSFNNIRLKSDLADRVGEQLMFGSDILLHKLRDPMTCEKLGFDTTTIVSMFIPNTYEIYWDINADQFLQRMKKEYDRFWSSDRLEKAQAIPLLPTEVSVLASIVEEETADHSEYPIVAGLYINRLKKGMMLQADPTVKFAVRDVTLQRILFRHLEVDSPYNTYKNFGLPPGPIRIPSIAGIDAVLNYAHHDYLYMVAKEDFSGKHNFAKNLTQHNINAKKYQQALNRAGIR